MEWCPSGCYEGSDNECVESTLQRIGLLAAACSDGKAHIFSICNPDELSKKFPNE